jgi:hypothetical protein
MEMGQGSFLAMVAPMRKPMPPRTRESAGQKSGPPRSPWDAAKRKKRKGTRQPPVRHPVDP